MKASECIAAAKISQAKTMDIDKIRTRVVNCLTGRGEVVFSNLAHECGFAAATKSFALLLDALDDVVECRIDRDYPGRPRTMVRLRRPIAP